MPAYDAGDIVVVPFPCSDRFSEKRRPALVVSGNTVHSAGLIWLVMITSSKKDSRPADHVIRDLAPTGLPVASTVRPLKIACVEPERILRKAGCLSALETSELLASTRALIGG